jgi:hypothetical protein
MILYLDTSALAKIYVEDTRNAYQRKYQKKLKVLRHRESRMPKRGQRSRESVGNGNPLALFAAPNSVVFLCCKIRY